VRNNKADNGRCGGGGTRALRWVTACGLVVGGLVATGTHVAGAAASSPVRLSAAAVDTGADGVTATLKWRDVIPCATPGATTCGFDVSSPTSATLDGQNDALVGSLDGHVYAFNLADGSNVPGWPASTDGQPVDSSPSVEPGTNDVFVGSGTDYTSPGGYWSFTPQGKERWTVQPTDTFGRRVSVYATLPIADINGDGIPDVTGGTLGSLGYSLTDNGALNTGWPFVQNDTIFSSPAVANLTGGPGLDVITGSDSSPNDAVNLQGGLLEALDGSGRVLWTHEFNEQVYSSPSVVQTATGPEIAVGTGDYWSRTNKTHYSDSTTVSLFSANGTMLWQRDTGAYTDGSPTIADITGDGQPDIIETTWGGGGTPYLPNPSAVGQVWAWDLAGNVLPGFPISLPDVTGPTYPYANPGGPGGTLGQAVTADVNGDGVQDLIVTGGFGTDIYDAKDHVLLDRINDESIGTFQNSALVVDNGDGSIDLIMAGTQQANGTNTANVIEDYRVTSPGGANVSAASWPMARHDARHTGSDAVTPLTTQTCTTATAPGYWEFAADGGVFSECLPFYGSIGGHALNQPVVGGAPLPDRSGYWEVASDGGIFSYGDAGFYGSTGSDRLNQPIVGMAPTADGHGYWLVARDGGVFAFGDAKFYGSTGGDRLNQPIVGMAATPDGGGYWLVASDGGIFAFGDAPFEGSTGSLKLNKPVVGMASSPSGLGYWLVGSDGGIFAFGDAHFAGSTGSLNLVAPVVGLAAGAL
jgi:hypothetical protein